MKVSQIQRRTVLMASLGTGIVLIFCLLFGSTTPAAGLSLRHYLDPVNGRVASGDGQQGQNRVVFHLKMCKQISRALEAFRDESRDLAQHMRDKQRR